MSENGTRSMSLYTATCLVVANMVGTGVFTSVGFQIGAGLTPFTILVLWLIGGLCAFCGGVVYGELAAALPRSGGEYHLLSRIFHPAIGFLAGWTSITAGFAAPVAMAAFAFGGYMDRTWAWNPVVSAGTAVIAITAIMLASPRARTFFQDTATSLKVFLLLVVIVLGWSVPATGSSLALQPGDARQMITPEFAVSLAWVMYAYMGWNASVYVAGEVRNPARNVPLSMAIGTLLVTLLYVLTNGAFLRLAPPAALENQVEAGLVAAEYGFGARGAMWAAILISLGLVSNIAAMQWIGPRVLATMGEDHRVLRVFTPADRRKLPMTATIVQTMLVLVLLFSGTFEQVARYIQFTLSMCSFLAVLGLFVLRYREPELARPIKAWGYPFTPLIYLGVNGWMLAHILDRNPRESTAGFVTLLTGLAVFYYSERRLK